MISSCVCALITLASTAFASAPETAPAVKKDAAPITIQGDYLESRTADIYTGPCFSNSEVFNSGDRAVMAWKVTSGKFQGVDLSGLCVAAAVQASSTFSYDIPDAARSVLIVDNRATPEQHDALVALAKHLGGSRLNHVAAVHKNLVTMLVERHGATENPAHNLHAKHDSGVAQFWSPGLASILARPLDDGDHVCGNEVVAYDPLSQNVDVRPAYTLANQYSGRDLKGRWSHPYARGTFVGSFAIAGQ